MPDQAGPWDGDGTAEWPEDLGAMGERDDRRDMTADQASPYCDGAASLAAGIERLMEGHVVPGSVVVDPYSSGNVIFRYVESVWSNGDIVGKMEPDPFTVSPSMLAFELAGAYDLGRFSGVKECPFDASVAHRCYGSVEALAIEWHRGLVDAAEADVLTAMADDPPVRHVERRQLLARVMWGLATFLGLALLVGLAIVWAR